MSIAPLNPPCVPWLSILANKADESLYLSLGDVFLQQFAVVVQQSSDGVLSQYVITYLTLHHTKLLRYMLLAEGGGYGSCHHLHLMSLNMTTDI